MKKLMIWGLALFLAAGVVWIAACSDDDSTAPDNEGDLEDPAFEFMNEVLGDGSHNLDLFGIEVYSQIFDSLENLGGRKPFPFRLAKAEYDVNFSSFELTSDNSWFVCTFTATLGDISPNFTITGTDSLGMLAKCWSVPVKT